MRKYLYFLLLITFCLTFRCFASGEIKYPVADIPENLKKNAGLIVRLNETNFEVKSMTSAVMRVHKVYTVMREDAADDGYLYLGYNKYCNISSLKASFYNSSGVFLNKLKSSDIVDESAIPDGSLYTDDRVKIIKPLTNTYPFTVEYEYEINFHKILYYPDWKPQFDYNISIEKAILNFTADDEMVPRFREVNLSSPMVTKNEKGITSVRYELENIQAIEEERFSPLLETLVPVVYMAPNDYKTLDYSADFRTWKSFGFWNSEMNKGREYLPDEVRKKINDLVKDKPEKIEKIKAIYRYVQQNTRYVNVALGIGGWQPVEAQTVAEKGYGDCKGLVNFTKALLSSVGIPSYYTLVKAGKNSPDIQLDFPSLQFNHIILTIPMDKDTLWLECTSQLVPFGYLGSFTCNRHVLLITGEGGVIARTPAYPGMGNVLARKIRIRLDSTGNATIGIVNHYRGLLYDDVMGMEISSIKERETNLYEKITIPSATIKKIDYRFIKEKIPEAIETIQLAVHSFASVSGNRMFIPQNLFKGLTVYLNDNTRKALVEIDNSYSVIDSVEIELPANYGIENLPSAVDLHSLFASYHATFNHTGNSIVCTRRRMIKEGTFPPESYADFISYLRNVVRSEKNSYVLLKK